MKGYLSAQAPKRLRARVRHKWGSAVTGQKRGVSLEVKSLALRNVGAVPAMKFLT